MNVYNKACPECHAKSSLKELLFFVRETHKNICSLPNILKQLRQNGISQRLVSGFQIGWNPDELKKTAVELGLQEHGNKEIILPQGIVLPIECYHCNELLCINIVDADSDGFSNKYGQRSDVIIPESRSDYVIIGNKRLPAMVVVSSIIDAYVLEAISRGKFFILALRNNFMKPNEEISYLFQTKTSVIVAYDDEFKNKIIQRLGLLVQNAYFHSLPHSGSVSEAARYGFNIRAWIYQALEA